VNLIDVLREGGEPAMQMISGFIFIFGLLIELIWIADEIQK
jgi:hypothetical protein